jgi:hypothetical protein
LSCEGAVLITEERIFPFIAALTYIQDILARLCEFAPNIVSHAIRGDAVEGCDRSTI